MRVTTQMLFRNALSDVERMRSRLADTQQRASSGLRILRPSDDPSGVRAALLLKDGLDRVAQHASSVSRVRGRVDATEAALGRASDVVVRARELAVQGANGALSAGERSALAAEVEQLHGELLAAANTRQGGQHVFAGHASDAAPFEASGLFQEGQPAPTVAFVGDASEIRVEIGEGVTPAVSLNGQRVFLGDADGSGAPDAGREDLFAVLADLRDALVADDPDAVGAVLGRTDAALEQLNAERGRIGPVQAQLERQEIQLQDEELRLRARLAEVEEADAAQVLSDLVQQEVALQASLDVTARLLQPSLLDFLR